MGCCCARPAQEGLLADESFGKNLDAGGTSFDPRQFEHPAQPIGVSGGTAAFYALLFRDEKCAKGRSKRHWVGKDLAHAADELAFYERAKRLLASEPAPWRLLRWMFDYGGVAEVPSQVGPRVEPRRMLLLRNLYDNAGQLRMLDVKIGSVTAVGGWQGKSHINAVKNRTIDQTTNSHVEGFRTEGFEHAPEELQSLLDASVRDRLRGVGGLDKLTHGLIDVRVEFSAGKKGRRLALQKLRASEFLSYWLHVPSEEPTLASLTAIEVAAHAYAASTRSVISLLSAASSVKVPQQWIGSSIALGYDLVIRPGRDESPPGARVQIFDWGRSELTTQDMWESLPDRDRKERTTHWREWVGGILRLGFEMCRTYRRMFCPKGGQWRKLRVKVWSYNQDIVSSVTTGTPVGSATIPLHAIPEQDITLDPPDLDLLQHFTHVHQHAIRALGQVDKAVEAAARRTKLGKMQVRLRVEGPGQFPRGSVFGDRWTVTIASASNLPKLDVLGWCNPVVSVALLDDEGAEATAHTSVVLNCKGGAAQWNQSFEFCAATGTAATAAALVPPALLERAPAESICDWQLNAAGGPASLHDQGGVTLSKQQSGSPRNAVEKAMRDFRDCFFVPTVEEEPAPQAGVDSVRDPRRAKGAGRLGFLSTRSGPSDADALADALQRLSATEKRLEEEVRRNRGLEEEVRTLRSAQLQTEAAMSADHVGVGRGRGYALQPMSRSAAHRAPPQRRRSEGAPQQLASGRGRHHPGTADAMVIGPQVYLEAQISSVAGVPMLLTPAVDGPSGQPAVVESAARAVLLQ